MIVLFRNSFEVTSSNTSTVFSNRIDTYCTVTLRWNLVGIVCSICGRWCLFGYNSRIGSYLDVRWRFHSEYCSWLSCNPSSLQKEDSDEPSRKGENKDERNFDTTTTTAPLPPPPPPPLHPLPMMLMILLSLPTPQKFRGAGLFMI